MDNTTLFIEMSLKAWKIYVDRVTKFLDNTPDEKLKAEIAPGKNTIIYLIGHLIAVHDNMIALYQLGDRSFAKFDEAFVKNPDKSGLEFPSPAEIRLAWKQSNELLDAYFAKMTPADWLGRHTAVSEADFAKEPFRNKLNLLLNRTSHMAYHLGQLILAKPKDA